MGASRYAALLRATLVPGAALTAYLLNAGSIADATHRFFHQLPSNPYFFPEQFLLLYVRVPLEIAGGFALLIVPGRLWLRRRECRGYHTDGVINHLVVVLGLHTVFGLVWKSVAGPLTAAPFLAWLLALNLAAAINTARDSTCTAVAHRADLRRLLIAGGAMYAVVLVLLPKFLWQDITGDGAEMFWAARSLDQLLWPTFPSASGLRAASDGVILHAYVLHWLTLVFTPVEASIRSLIFAMIPLLFFGLLALAEWESPRRLTPKEEICVALAVVSFALTLGWNATYHAYATDLTSPPAGALLTTCTLLACVLAYWRRHLGALVVWAVVAWLARPTVVILLLSFGVGLVLDRRWRDRAAWRLVAVSIASVIAVAVGEIAIGLAEGGSGFLSRYAYLNLTEVRRVAWAAAPAGWIPFLCIFLWRWLDAQGRTLAVASATILLAFYLPAFVSLHHYAPIMVLCVPLFWRLALKREWHRWSAPVVATLTIGSILLAVPSDLSIDRTFRRIGQSLVLQVGSIKEPWSDAQPLFTAHEGWRGVFPALSSRPTQERTGSPLSYFFYARSDTSGGFRANYWIVPATQSLPPHARVVFDSAGVVIAVRDTVTWHADRYGTFGTPFRAPMYAIEKETLFSSIGIPAKRYDLAPSEMPLLWRLFP